MSITPLEEKLKVQQSCVLACLGQRAGAGGQLAEREGAPRLSVRETCVQDGDMVG